MYYSFALLMSNGKIYILLLQSHVFFIGGLVKDSKKTAFLSRILITLVYQGQYILVINAKFKAFF